MYVKKDNKTVKETLNNAVKRAKYLNNNQRLEMLASIDKAKQILDNSRIEIEKLMQH